MFTGVSRVFDNLLYTRSAAQKLLRTVRSKAGNEGKIVNKLLMIAFEGITVTLTIV